MSYVARVIRQMSVVGIVLIVSIACRPDSGTVTLGISPYQDTYLPGLAAEKGWFEEAGVDVRVVDLAWGEVMSSVMSTGGADIAITNFNTFLASSPSMVDQGGDPVFVYPLFIFKGPAILARDSTAYETVEEIRDSRGIGYDSAVRVASMQLEGRRVITTENTEMEQIVVEAGRRAGLRRGEDYGITHASPEDGLAAFLGGEGDLYSGGLTERLRAQQQGAIAIIEGAHVSPPVIDGFVMKRSSLERIGPEKIAGLVEVWFRLIQYIRNNPVRASEEFAGLLNRVASTQYGAQELRVVWEEMEVFLANRAEVDTMVLDGDGRYYWREVWQDINEFLVSEGSVSVPVDETRFLGDSIHGVVGSPVGY